MCAALTTLWYVADDDDVMPATRLNDGSMGMRLLHADVICCWMQPALATPFFQQGDECISESFPYSQWPCRDTTLVCDFTNSQFYNTDTTTSRTELSCLVNGHNEKTIFVTSSSKFVRLWAADPVWR